MLPTNIVAFHLLLAIHQMRLKYHVCNLSQECLPINAFIWVCKAVGVASRQKGSGIPNYTTFIHKSDADMEPWVIKLTHYIGTHSVGAKLD